MNARRKVEQMRAAQKRRERKRRATVAGIAATSVAGAAALAIAYWPHDSGSKVADAGQPTVLAAAGQLNGSAVDGIESGAMEQLAFHIHSHLQIYVDGKQRLVPAGVGIMQNVAIYWLHTHDESGIIHMEAPKQVSFTLGEFFDLWKQPLSTGQVGPAKGPVTAFVDGKPVTGDPRQVKLDAHSVIQLDVGEAVAFQPYSFPDGV